MSDPRRVLSRATEQFRLAEARHELARRVLVDAIVGALNAGVSPTEVAKLSPFSATHVRLLAREHGVPPAPRGGPRPGPRARREGGRSS